MIKKIISGGQTGVDQAALFVATELGIDIGGWCPKGGLDEDNNCIHDHYNSMQDAQTAHPDERTKLNIEASDGTLIIVPSLPLPEKIKDGTLLTIEFVKEKKKPYFIIRLDQADSSSEFGNWLNENNIFVLNIAGPRESNAPGINKHSIELLRDMIKSLRYDYCY